MNLQLLLNNVPLEAEAPAEMTLADLLRDTLGATGTHVGCAHGVCGACTVIVNGQAVRSCLMLAVQAQGARVETVEGLSPVGTLSPLQAAFKRQHALQCGFCTPGMLMTLHALLSYEPFAEPNRIREVLSGNLCRCTGYLSIVAAALDAQTTYQHGANGRDG